MQFPEGVSILDLKRAALTKLRQILSDHTKVDRFVDADRILRSYEFRQLSISVDDIASIINYFCVHSECHSLSMLLQYFERNKVAEWLDAKYLVYVFCRHHFPEIGPGNFLYSLRILAEANDNDELFRIGHPCVHVNRLLHKYLCAEINLSWIVEVCKTTFKVYPDVHSMLDLKDKLHALNGVVHESQNVEQLFAEFNLLRSLDWQRGEVFLPQELYVACHARKKIVARYLFMQEINNALDIACIERTLSGMMSCAVAWLSWGEVNRIIEVLFCKTTDETITAAGDAFKKILASKNARQHLLDKRGEIIEIIFYSSLGLMVGLTTAQVELAKQIISYLQGEPKFKAVIALFVHLCGTPLQKRVLEIEQQLQSVLCTRVSDVIEDKALFSRFNLLFLEAMRCLQVFPGVIQVSAVAIEQKQREFSAILQVQKLLQSLLSRCSAISEQFYSGFEYRMFLVSLQLSPFISYIMSDAVRVIVRQLSLPIERQRELLDLLLQSDFAANIAPAQLFDLCILQQEQNDSVLLQLLCSKYGEAKIAFYRLLHTQGDICLDLARIRLESECVHNMQPLLVGVEQTPFDTLKQQFVIFGASEERLLRFYEYAALPKDVVLSQQFKQVKITVVQQIIKAIKLQLNGSIDTASFGDILPVFLRGVHVGDIQYNTDIFYVFCELLSLVCNPSELWQVLEIFCGRPDCVVFLRGIHATLLKFLSEDEAIQYGAARYAVKLWLGKVLCNYSLYDGFRQFLDVLCAVLSCQRVVPPGYTPFIFLDWVEWLVTAVQDINAGELWRGWLTLPMFVPEMRSLQNMAHACLLREIGEITNISVVNDENVINVKCVIAKLNAVLQMQLFQIDTSAAVGGGMLAGIFRLLPWVNDRPSAVLLAQRDGLQFMLDKYEQKCAQRPQ